MVWPAFLEIGMARIIFIALIDNSAFCKFFFDSLSIAFGNGFILCAKERNYFANSVLSSGNICKSPTKTKTNYDELCNRRIYFFNFSQNFFEKSYKIITFKILHKRMCFFPIYFRKVIYFVCNQIKIVQYKNRFLECISKFFNATL